MKRDVELREGADTAPLLELTHVRTLYFDRLAVLGAVDGNLRLLLWRWKTLGGLLVRMPVLELVRPARATSEIRSEVDRALVRPPWEAVARH